MGEVEPVRDAEKLETPNASKPAHAESTALFPPTLDGIAVGWPSRCLLAIAAFCAIVRFAPLAFDAIVPESRSLKASPPPLLAFCVDFAPPTVVIPPVLPDFVSEGDETYEGVFDRVLEELEAASAENAS